LDSKHRWYYPQNVPWENLAPKAQLKARIVRVYANHNNSYDADHIHYDDYSEFFVSQALIQNQFTINAYHARKIGNLVAFGPKVGPGRPRDLDLISSKGRARIGIQVKNRLDYPEAESIRNFLILCKQLQLTPVLVVRQAPLLTLKSVTDEGGYVIVCKQWMLRPPFPRETLNDMRELGIPAAVYQRVPDFLIRKFHELALWLDSKQLTQ